MIRCGPITIENSVNTFYSELFFNFETIFLIWKKNQFFFSLVIGH
jgi:hypothetical protein